jgi:mRNA interferase MazF
VNRGEVWWLEDPELGRRPVCILSREAAIPVLKSVLVAPATTTVRGIPTEVELGTENGMPKRCALSLDNTTVVPKAHLTRRITRLSVNHLVELCAALRYATGC